MIIKMRHIEKDNIPKELYNMVVAIYGGGHTGKIIADLLVSRGIEIRNIIDDNEGIHGTYIHGIEVVSYSGFCKRIHGQQAAVILTTIYGKTVLKKMEKLPELQVYEMYNWYSELIGKKDAIQKMLQESDKMQEMRKQINSLRDKWEDGESARVLDGLTHFLESQDINDIADVCTEEEQYFIPEILKVLPQPLNILEGGLRGTPAVT